MTTDNASPSDLDLLDDLIATGEIGERPTGYTGMKPYGTTLRARRVLRLMADAGRTIGPAV